MYASRDGSEANKVCAGSGQARRAAEGKGRAVGTRRLRRQLSRPKDERDANRTNKENKEERKRREGKGK